MKNFVANGSSLTFTNETENAIASGAGVLLGAALFGIASGPVAAGAGGVLNLTGIYDLPKQPSQAWAVGAAVYWSSAEGIATTAKTGNILIGVAVAAVGGGAGDVIGRVRLNGTFG